MHNMKMKTRLLIICIVVFSLVILVPQAFAIGAPPPERVPISTYHIVNSEGATTDVFNVGEQITFDTDLANAQDKEQLVIYVVEIYDYKGVKLHSGTMEGTLAPQMSFSPAVSWIPEKTGFYSVKFRILEDLQTQSALSPNIDAEFHVIRENLDTTKNRHWLYPDRECSEDKQVVTKYDKSKNVCVFQTTLQKLVERGWALDEAETEPEPKRATEDEMNLRDARQKLREIYHLNSSFGPFNIKDAIVGYGIAGDVLVVDVLTEYYESDHLNLIKQKIRDIVGPKVTIEFSPSGAIVPTSIESVFPYVWNSFLHQNGIEFTPKEQTYANTDEGYDEHNRVCSPIVAANGTEFYISSTFIKEPFEITGTFIDKTMPDDCFKIWKTDTILVEPDRILMLWLENYHRNN